jgi:hypothetical protein
VSLDKDASSDPNLKAVHAGASMRKAQHFQAKASDVADAEVGCFAFSRLAAHIRVLSKSGETPTLPAKRSLCLFLVSPPAASLGTQLGQGADLVVTVSTGHQPEELGGWHHVNTPQAGAGTSTNVGSA